MKVGFIIDIENSIAKIKHKYGEDAEFITSEYVEDFECGDIVLFNFGDSRNVISATNVKLVSEETSFCRQNKNLFHDSQWNLILKGNDELLFEYFQNKIEVEQKQHFESIKNYCDYIYPKLLELISYAKPYISRWSNYKVGERYDSGLINHNVFDIPKDSKIIEEMLPEKFLFNPIHFIRNSTNQFDPCSDFIIHRQGQYVGKFIFTEKLATLFNISPRIDIEEERFNEEINYKKSIIEITSKQHIEYTRFLENQLSIQYLLDVLYSKESRIIEQHITQINHYIYDWKYLEVFPHLKNVFGKIKLST